MVVVFVRQFLDIEFLLEIIDGVEAVDEPGILIPCGQLDRIRFARGHGVTDDLLQDIIHCQEADDAAVLIEDHGFMRSRIAELLQYAERLHGAGDEQRLADVLGQIQCLAFQ